MALRLAAASTGGTDRCATVLEGETLAPPISQVRFTMRSRGPDGTTLAICDHKVDLGSTPPFLRVESQGATAVDLFVEAYGPAESGDSPSAGGVRRLASGALYGVAPGTASLGALQLYPTERFRCAPARLGTPRAFHSATRLPDGQVLLVGGLVGSGGDPTSFPRGGATATGSAEIYDPRTHAVTAVSETSTPGARAFHNAALLNGSGPCPAGQIGVLLAGGVAPVTAGQAVLAPSSGAQDGRLVPFDTSLPIPAPLRARAVGDEVLCLDLAGHAASRVPLPGTAATYRAAGLGPQGLVAAGGIDYDPAALNADVPKPELTLFFSSGDEPLMQGGVIGRRGATLTALDGARALVWGSGSDTDPIGEALGSLDGLPTVVPLSAPGATRTQFHTGTRVQVGGREGVLVTGGFEVSTAVGAVNNQPPGAAAAVRLVSLTGPASAPTVTSQPVPFGPGFSVDPLCADANRYRPAGHESAVGLTDGRVLITGGTPSNRTVGTRCGDCVEPDNTSLLCALPQAATYESSGQLRRALEPLGVARFGHASTLLDDGSVLISGGIGSEPRAGTTTPIFVSDLEVYNPRALVPRYDSGADVIDADDPIAEDLRKLGLQRAPGQLAVSPDQPDQPARACGTL